MKPNFSILFALLLVHLTLNAQESIVLNYASQIDSTNLRTTLSKLASDEFEGRGTGQKGGVMATQYLSEYLKSKGVIAANKGSYLQNIEAFNRDKGRKRFELDNFDYAGDYSYENTAKTDSIISSDKIIFAGYGTYSSTYNDFANINITDKIVMIFNDVPYNKFGLNYALSDLAKQYIEEKKPKAIIKVQSGFRGFSNYSSRRIQFPNNSWENKIPEIYINERLANKILEPIGKTFKQIAYEVEANGVSPSKEINIPFSFSGDYIFEDANANNIVAIIEGSDLKNEYIVLSAHYDHEGIQYGGLYNGADDNASGVSSVLEIARILAKAKKEGKGPRRSVIILLPTAEEKGLIGSKYYVDNPIFPLDKTVACLNLDMLGRVSYGYEGKGNNYVYVVNHKKMSGNLVQHLEEANRSLSNFTLDYKHTTPGDDNRYFSRSDQYNFAEKNIPSIMLTSGEHKDYHKTTDDVEFIDFDGLYKRTKLAFLFLWNIANSDKKFNEVEVELKAQESLKGSEIMDISM